jgi:hypothetical protein
MFERGGTDLFREALIKSHSSDNCQTSRFFQKSPLGSGQSMAFLTVFPDFSS